MRLVSAFGFVLALSVAAPSFAQRAPAPPPAAPAAPAAKKNDNRKKDGGKVIRGGFDFLVKARRPEAYYLLSRANLSYPEVELKQSFLGKVVESADHTPSD